uniref:Vesicle transport protein n=1 Tax=Panagrellus redivivus TaxID=6233 RepID=A0A7E4UWM8_PANRE
MPTLKRCKEIVNEAITDIDRSVIKRYLRKNCGIVVDDNFESVDDLDVSNPTYLNESLEFVRGHIDVPNVDVPVDATDEVKSVYAFEGKSNESNKKDEVDSVYAFGSATDATGKEKPMETEEAELLDASDDANNNNNDNEIKAMIRTTETKFRCLIMLGTVCLVLGGILNLYGYTVLAYAFLSSAFTSLCCAHCNTF